jgi:hypothetical protein
MTRKTLEIKQHPDGYKAIYIDGVLFDWGLEPEDIERAKKFSRHSQTLKETLQRDIRKHFTDSFAEFLGKAISLKEINDSIERGWIEV